MTYPFGAVPPLQLQATTGVAGFALQNATPTILTWTAPNDGNLHRFVIFLGMHVTSAETGGQIQVVYKLPDGQSAFPTVFSGGQAAGFNGTQITWAGVCEAGQTVNLEQVTALTAGAALLWAELWGS